jgi:hypothetical protein
MSCKVAGVGLVLTVAAYGTPNLTTMQDIWRPRFEALAEGARVTELSGAHHLFISNPPEVLQQIDGFMSSIAATR